MPRRINWRKARARANEAAVGAKNKKRQDGELWKWRVCGNRGKPKAGFPLFPQTLGNLAKSRRDSHISTAPATRRMEKWKTKNRFPTFPPPSLYAKTKNRGPPGGLRPPPGGRRFAPPKSQSVI